MSNALNEGFTGGTGSDGSSSSSSFSSSSSRSSSSSSSGSTGSCASIAYTNWAQTDWAGNPSHATGGDLMQYNGVEYKANGLVNVKHPAFYERRL